MCSLVCADVRALSNLFALMYLLSGLGSHMCDVLRCVLRVRRLAYPLHRCFLLLNAVSESLVGILIANFVTAFQQVVLVEIVFDMKNCSLDTVSSVVRV